MMLTDEMRSTSVWLAAAGDGTVNLDYIYLSRPEEPFLSIEATCIPALQLWT